MYILFQNPRLLLLTTQPGSQCLPWDDTAGVASLPPPAELWFDWTSAVNQALGAASSFQWSKHTGICLSGAQACPFGN